MTPQVVLKYLNLDTYLSFYDGQSQFIQTGLLICSLFTAVSVCIVLILFYQRFRKNKKNRRKQDLINASMDFITSYLFDEDLDKTAEINHFRKRQLLDDFDKKITIQQILVYANNLKGESTQEIKDLFAGLKLDAIVLGQLESHKWENKARALYVLSELSIAVDPSKFMHLINAERIEVRQQSMLYVLKLAKNNPLDFLDRLERPLTLWQEIYIENSLKYDYKGDIPDFSKWLDHKFETVNLFSIRMIAQFNQFENLTKVASLLKSDKNTIRQEVIRCLGKIGDDAIIPDLISNFKNESRAIQLEILELIKNNGTYDQFLGLLPYVIKAHATVQVTYFNINRSVYGNQTAFSGDLVEYALIEKPLQPNMY